MILGHFLMELFPKSITGLVNIGTINRKLDKCASIYWKFSYTIVLNYVAVTHDISGWWKDCMEIVLFVNCLILNIYVISLIWYSVLWDCWLVCKNILQKNFPVEVFGGWMLPNLQWPAKIGKLKKLEVELCHNKWMEDICLLMISGCNLSPFICLISTAWQVSSARQFDHAPVDSVCRLALSYRRHSCKALQLNKLFRVIFVTSRD